jgi:hypothetical protein
VARCFLTDNGQDVTKICYNNCDTLKRELQETLGELKSARLINELLQTNATHMVKLVSTNNVNNISGEILCFVDRASLYNLVNKANLVLSFSLYVYFFSLRVSGDYVRRNNYI